MGVKIRITAPGGLVKNEGSEHLFPVLRGWEGVVSDEDAKALISAGCAEKAHDGGQAEDTEVPLEKRSNDEIRAYADERRIDLGDATTKKDMLAAIDAANGTPNA